MKISSKARKNINRFLLIGSILIAGFAMWGVQIIVRQISADERSKVKMWAASVQQKAELITYSRNFFDHIGKIERYRLKLWAEAVSGMYFARSAAEFYFFNQVIEENTDIPVIITDRNFRILHCVNVDIDCSTITYLRDTLLTEFSELPPIRIPLTDDSWKFFYKQSREVAELQQILNNVIHSFMDEIVDNSIFAPILVVCSEKKKVIQYGNISPERFADSITLSETLSRMSARNPPIEVSIDANQTYLIFYERSTILRRLSYIPFIVFVVFITFIISIVWGMKMSREFENSRLWVGMSRETAHQLGTPLTSLIGWTEYLKTQNVDENHLAEMEKDIDRLVIISERFSKIGSQPKLTTQNIVQLVYKTVAYLQPRISQKIKLQVNVPPNAVILTSVNTQLLEWVLENITTNAVDAIGPKEGLISIKIVDQSKTVIMDITDTGRGIPKAQRKTVFEAGVTTKSRGWGLGLPLCYRIIHNYHKGDIFVKHSAVGEGTTIRIILNK